jgi:hypothetical protein
MRPCPNPSYFKYREGYDLVGNCFPKLGPQLFVITGEAAISHSRSFPILMGWWSAQCNDIIKVLIAAGRARQHHPQC